MNDNPPQNIVNQLALLAKEKLITTAYASNDPNFEVKQYEFICKEIIAIYSKFPKELAEILNNEKNVYVHHQENIPTEHLQNIGISADTCIRLMADPQYDYIINDNRIRYLVGQFLSSVKKQAQKACKNRYSLRGGKYLISDEDVETIRKSLSEQREELTNFLNEERQRLEEMVNNIATKTASAEASAKKAAEDAQYTANQIKESAKVAIASAKAAKKTAKEMKKSAQNATNSANEAKETANQMLPNMLSVLGILVGIVVAIVGCYLSILLGEHNADIKTAVELSRPFEFARYLVMGQTTTIVVFLLMYLISRISRHTLSCSCSMFNPIAGYEEPHIHDCTKCTKKCSIAVRFVRRYPYLFGINAACCIGYAMLALWQFINVYFRDVFDSLIVSLGFGKSLLVFFLVSLLAMVAILIVVAFYVLGYRAIKWLLSKTKPQ